jgi:hypothetical protein
MVEDIETRLRSATAAAAESQTAAAVANAQLAAKTARRGELAISLQSARADNADADLETGAAATASAVAERVADREIVKEQYRRSDPEGVAAGLSTAENAKEIHEANLQRIRDESTWLAAQLEISGGAGIVEDLQKAVRNVFISREDVTRYVRRAQAAKLLYETLTGCRDEAQKSSVDPLKAAIERLGIIIFGEQFRVVIGETLGVESRVMNGITIPYATSRRARKSRSAFWNGWLPPESSARAVFR